MNYCLEVSGDFACFTRPEMKVERVSYDVITPSAARAVFEAILWKPLIRWRIRRIEVLKPIRWMSLRRNELSGVISVRNAEAAMKTGSGHLAQYIEEERQQRAGLFLRDVSYRVYADLEIKADAGPQNPIVKFQEMFQRRADKGQCVNQPYLGCREFSARFRRIEDISVEPPTIPDSLDLGYMLHDLDFTDPSDPQPRFFRARMENGAIDIPSWDAEGVRR